MGKFSEERIQKRVRTMTNWQRTKWARAGYPTKTKDLKKFAKMKRPQNA